MLCLCHIIRNDVLGSGKLAIYFFMCVLCESFFLKKYKSNNCVCNSTTTFSFQEQKWQILSGNEHDGSGDVLLLRSVCELDPGQRAPHHHHRRVREGQEGAGGPGE